MTEAVFLPRRHVLPQRLTFSQALFIFSIKEQVYDCREEQDVYEEIMSRDEIFGRVCSSIVDSCCRPLQCLVVTGCESAHRTDGLTRLLL